MERLSHRHQLSEKRSLGIDDLVQRADETAESKTAADKVPQILSK